MDALPPAAESTARAHVVSRFTFDLPVPPDRAAPLFTPEGERAWAGADWDPQFIHPRPARDVEGAVFTLDRAGHHAVWVNTRLDPTAGRMQYVAFIPGAMVTTIDVALRGKGAGTEVEVTYQRTALTAEADGHVTALGETDKAAGPHWQAAITAALP